MTNLKEILQNYLFFGVIFAIFLVALVIFLLVFNNKEKKRSIFLYGLLMNMKNTEIFSLCLILINFLLLVYTLIMKIELTLSYAIISMVTIITAFAIIKKGKHLFINSIINMVNIALVYLANLVNTLRLDNPGTTYLILQIAMNVFGMFFYIFATLKFIKNIRNKGDINEENN